MAEATRPELAEIDLSDRAEAWQALGFAVTDGVVALGGVSLRLEHGTQGIGGWALRGVADGVALDGLVTRVIDTPPVPTPEHPNGAIGFDHVVVLCPDFDRATATFAAAGMPMRRERVVGSGEEAFRQGFRRLGPGIAELVEQRSLAPGPARFWGLTLLASDLDAFAARLGPERCSAPRAAVQPGRRIVSLRREAGLSIPVAVMDPEPPRS